MFFFSQDRRIKVLRNNTVIFGEVLFNFFFNLFDVIAVKNGYYIFPFDYLKNRKKFGIFLPNKTCYFHWSELVMCPYRSRLLHGNVLLFTSTWTRVEEKGVLSQNPQHLKVKTIWPRLLFAV